MRTVTISDIVADAGRMNLDARSLDSYREFLSYFSNLETITRHNFIIGASFAYSWMPTMLNFKIQEFDKGVELLQKVKDGEMLSQAELCTMKGIVNNSLIGTSKLLHFVNPINYAIWDSRVCKYITGNGSVVENIQSYFSYLENCKEIVCQKEFAAVHSRINADYGFDVTPYRAVELIMYTCSG